MASTENVSAYLFAYPTDVAYDSAIAQFLETMWGTADTPDMHTEYANLFASDATLQVGSKTIRGRAEVRKVMWEDVPHRVHMPLKVFPFGGADEVMVIGTAHSWPKSETGVEMEVEFATRRMGN